ncbi:DUF4320 family protein [Anaerocolumna sp. AGMB13020]|uniref:DUF4320 family protein n=1 Tax=Anaerocolumna sp. AGMB13020 TaxID=3081750 RepID=UPI00295565E3|nr:DUF4320 family protein [Anaerocolumna sp. AGMB13020]WOO35776.1 DUF4320 family protein [Anaerocolumna sp. AGMB13020]
MTRKKNKISKILKDKSGAATYLEMVVTILIVAIVVVFIVKVVPVLVLKNQLNTFATSVSRIISVEGRYDNTVREAIEELRQKSEVGNVTITLDGSDFISGGEKIQLNDIIQVNVTTQYDLGFFTFGSFPITLKNTAQSRSEVYWK